MRSNTRTGKVLVPSTSFSHLLDPPSSSAQPSPPINIVEDVSPNGIPVIITSEPSAYAYDLERAEWTSIVSPWWLESSPLTDRHHPRGPLADIEQQVMDAWKGRPVDGIEKPEWWNEAIEMGHLENRMRAALLLDSGDEYKYWLLKYATILGKEGFRARAEELIKDLVGPIYQ